LPPPAGGLPAGAGTARAGIRRCPCRATGAKAIAPVATIDAYKLQVAQQIMDANTQFTFSGRLPSMLPAIVVLDLSVSAMAP
jgi:protein TonB